MAKFNHQLYIYNNEVYDMKTIIDSLMFVVEIHSQQAEQCTLIAHHNGKAVIKQGSKKVLLEIQQGLSEILPELDTEISKITPTK